MTTREQYAAIIRKSGHLSPEERKILADSAARLYTHVYRSGNHDKTTYHIRCVIKKPDHLPETMDFGHNEEFITYTDLFNAHMSHARLIGKLEADLETVKDTYNITYHHTVIEMKDGSTCHIFIVANGGT